MAFGETDARVIVGTHHGHVLSWQWRRSVLEKLGELPASVDSIVYAPDGEEFVAASGAAGRGVYFWTFVNGEWQAERVPGVASASTVSYARDGSCTLVLTLSGAARMLQRTNAPFAPRALDVTKHQSTLHRPMIFSLSLSSDNRQAVVAGGHGLLLRIYDVSDGWKSVSTMAPSRRAAIQRRPAQDAIPDGSYDWRQHGHVLSTAVSPSGATFATGDAYGNIHEWRWQALSDEPRVIDQSGSGIVWALSYSADGSLLAATYEPGEIRIYNVRDSPTAEVARFNVSDRPMTIRALLPSAQPRSFYAAVDEGGVLWFRTSAEGLRRKWIHVHSGMIWAFAKSPQHDRAILVGAGPSLFLLGSSEPEMGDWRRTAVAESLDAATSAAWSGDERRFAVGFSDGSVRTWDALRLAQPPVAMQAGKGYVRAVALAARGEFLLTGGDDGTVTYFSLKARDAADAVCALVMRNLTKEEWTDVIGIHIAYERTCPNLPAAEGAGDR